MFDKNLLKEQITKNAPSKPCFTQGLWMAFFGAFVGTACVYFLFFIASTLVNPPLSQLFSFVQAVLPVTPVQHKLTSQEEAVVVNLISHGNLISMDTIVSSLMNYYNTIITILLGLVAASCTLSFLYVKSSSESLSQDLAKQAALKEVEHYLESHSFVQNIDVKFETFMKDKSSSILQKAVEIEVNKLRADMQTYVDSLVDDTTNFENRIKAIEDKIAAVDKTEEFEGNGIEAAPSTPEGEA